VAARSREPSITESTTTFAPHPHPNPQRAPSPSGAAHHGTSQGSDPLAKLTKPVEVLWRTPPSFFFFLFKSEIREKKKWKLTHPILPLSFPPFNCISLFYFFSDFPFPLPLSAPLIVIVAPDPNP
jgi:hypothetical protein